jgi:hypothetical protein
MAGGTLRMSNFIILSMRYIKLAQKIKKVQIFSFLTCKGEAVGVVQIFANGGKGA